MRFSDIAPMIVVAAAWLAGSCALLMLAFRKAMAARWHEPVLVAPVLVLESDDWGYGPPSQARALDRIAETLSAFRDRLGRHPVMTAGVVLAGPDTDRMRAEGCLTYHRLGLSDPRLAPVRDALSRGVARGVFSLQLHGMEHFWPDCLMRAAAASDVVRGWLTGSGFPSTEALPSPMQSRWIDATRLPSTPLPVAQAAAAAAEECRVYATTFGGPPEVAVPPTFIWTQDVEAAWAGAGVRVVVTPGIRCESRDREGQPVASDGAFSNGMAGPHGVLYVVRENYFEPTLGHTHLDALQALTHNTRLGRPTLLEIHRMNFIGDERSTRLALDEVTRLFQVVSTRFPDIRFMSTAELARHYRDRSELVAPGPGARIHVLLRRLAEIPRLRKLAWATGVVLPAWLAYLLTAPWALRGTR